MSKCNDSHKMSNLVDISSIVARESDFFSIKDKIIDKMLEVVHPTKACVNLFYKNNYKYAYLVCSQTLSAVPQIFPMCSLTGVKIDFDIYPKYIHEAVREKKIIYIKNVFEDDRAKEEWDLAKEEGYIGRIVFPLIANNIVVGFMTCFLGEEDFITQGDIDFISSVASLISLSIEVTTKNNNKNILIHKLRGAISSINEATKRLYLNKNITEFLDHLSKQACNITNSEEALIIINEHDYKDKISSSYSHTTKNKITETQVINNVIAKKEMGAYYNHIEYEDCENLDSYIYYKLEDRKKVVGCIVCANSKNYTNDDLNILSILAKQVSVGIQLYEYNLTEVKHKVLANELNVLSKQQKLIMDKSKMECNDEKELSYYHKPATVVGGDFYYAMRVDEDTIIYILADVMGHGIVSNYVVAMIKGAFKVLCHRYKTSGEIMTNLNKILYDEFDKMGVFTTCLISVFNTKENSISISNAGHYSPIIVDEDGNLVDNLNCVKGVPLGILEDSKYVDNVVDINSYPIICMYTDGVLEIKNKLKEEYGVERFKSFIQRNFDFNKQQIIDNLKKDLRKFSLADDYDDDILVVMLKNK
ncbi:MAG: SpoIIE family protein phosphatase [Romboutsia sp.]